jgi:hypothetical protein
VGQTQTFEAVVKGTRSTGIQWAVAERNGGRITEDGIYTAPRHLGLYHVVATRRLAPGDGDSVRAQVDIARLAKAMVIKHPEECI